MPIYFSFYFFLYYIVYTVKKNYENKKKKAINFHLKKHNINNTNLIIDDGDDHDFKYKNSVDDR